MDIHDLIEQHLAGVDFGTMQLTIKKDRARVASVDFQKYTSHKTDGNEQALAIVIALLKAMQQAAETGNLTFNVMLKNGIADRVVVQDFKRIAL